MAGDIRTWLEGLGLGKYADTFVANDVEFDVLHELNDRDLERLGVSLGHRKKLLRAVAASEADGTLNVSQSSKALPIAAERRQLTVMFIDLVGSTELSRRLDPEEMREVMRSYQNLVAGEVARFEGYVAKFMGDGVLVYFGWPQAHEDETERAVRAGLAIINAVSRLKAIADQPLAVRVGIATGLVVVGDLIGEGAAQEQSVVGETPNLAARLQALAEPGTVAIGLTTRRQLGELFELADLGEHYLKGFDEPIQVWRVVGESEVESRFEALHGQRLTPLVGREHEIGLLLEYFDLAKQGEGQVILLSGEPGIGKSRTIRVLREQLQEGTYTSLNHFCSPFHTNSAAYPIINLLERAARFQREDPPMTKLDKLEALLAQSSTNVAEVTQLAAGLLMIPTEQRYPPLNLTPEEQKRLTLEVLVDQIAGLAAKQPVLVVFEDVHWIDPTTLEFLDLVIDRVHGLAALVIVTFRPEFVPPWTSRGHITSLALNRLGRRQGASMIEGITAGKALPQELSNLIVAKTDGVPLFIEELTKTLLESGLLREAEGAFVLLRPLPSLVVPATLQDSLLARLDRLGPAQETAQIGAALGREFSYELLAALTPLSSKALEESLAQLVSAGLLFARGQIPDATYMFKHALIQDVAYAKLLKSQRQQLHSRITRVLKERFPERVSAQPELLAHHLTEAGETEAAVASWLIAGQQAAERSANAEAVAHLRRALDLLKGLPDTVERQRQELALQIALGTPLMAIKGYGAPELEEANSRARQLCDQVGAVTQLLPILYRQWAYHIVHPETHMARRLAEEFLRAAEDQGAMGPALVARRAVGFTQYGHGELAQSQSNLSQVCELYDAERDRGLAFQFGQDNLPAALAALSIVTWLLGDVDNAQQMRDSAITRANDIGHAPTLAYARTFAGCMFSVICRDWHSAREHGAALLAFTEQHRLPLWHAWANLYHSRAVAELVPAQTDVTQMQKALAETQATGTRRNITLHLALLAEVYGLCDQVTNGLAVIEKALAEVDLTDEHWWEAEIHRVKGELLLSLGIENAADAEACFERAMAISRAQAAKSLELRATISLARLWKDSGRKGDAVGLLEPICGWFKQKSNCANTWDALEVLDGV